MQLAKTKLNIALKKVMPFNPYFNKCIKFYKDKIPYYIFSNNTYSTEDLDAEYKKVAEKDIQSGYRDRMGGYYDKWYRYNRYDEGRAYDEGVKIATTYKKCPSEMHIIEIEH